MIPIIVISHGEMTIGMKRTTEMIIGKQEELYFISLKQDKPEEFPSEIKALLETYSKDQEILILADLFGGSPFLTVAEYIMEGYPNARLVAGVNLPMLLECTISRSTMDIDQLADLSVKTGKEAIRKLSIAVKEEVITNGI